MRNLPLLFTGIFASLALSWTGLALVNHNTLGRLTPIPQDPIEEGQNLAGQALYPRQRSGEAYRGAREYAELGCINCHTQQIRIEGFGNDISRKLGPRATVSRDYIRDERVMLGNIRIGEDLANIGDRIKDSNTFHLQLFDARILEPRSLMPSHRFLYEVRDIQPGKQISDKALILPKTLKDDYALEFSGKEIIPSDRAEDLVAYLKSLKLDYSLPEAPFVTEE